MLMDASRKIIHKPGLGGPPSAQNSDIALDLGVEPVPDIQMPQAVFSFGETSGFGQMSVALNSISPSSREDPELLLLHPSGQGFDSGTHLASSHEVSNAPLMTAQVVQKVTSLSTRSIFPQRSLLGSIVSEQLPRSQFHLPINQSDTPSDRKLYLNTNTPFSAVICGVQGSGKSHTASVILEGCLIPNSSIGRLPKPLAGLCLLYDSALANSPCESAYLGTPNPRLETSGANMVPVTILVSPTSVATMKKVYCGLKNVTVEPFHIAVQDLNSSRMLSLMGCDDTQILPLYLQRAMTILRAMGADKFNYKGFKQNMSREKLNPAQKSMFKLRTDMLDSYLSEKSPPVGSHFKSGQLVVIDLRDPFTDTSLASSLFEIVVGLFVEKNLHTGKVLLLDEAHKYLSSNPSSSKFTTSVASLIRQQRHLGIRTLISTQEPTVIPSAILDLASVLIIHRFSSPSWSNHLKSHIAIDLENWEKIVARLGLGEALIISPSGLIFHPSTHKILPLSTGYLVSRTRKRLTRDGGASIVVCK